MIAGHLLFSSSHAFVLQAFKIVAGATGAGTVTFALLGFGTSTPDFSAIRQDLADLMDDDTVVNPSKDEGVQGGGGVGGDNERGKCGSIAHPC